MVSPNASLTRDEPGTRFIIMIIFGLTDIDLNVYFRLKGPENARIRGNPYKIVVNQCRLNVRKTF